MNSQESEHQGRPTQQGKEHLSRLMLGARARMGISDWGVFTEVLIEKFKVNLTRDSVYKVSSGRYSTEPPFKVIYCLTQLPEFQFDDGTQITMEDVFEVLYERIDIASKTNDGS